MKHRFSYFRDDPAIFECNAAFAYDRPEGIESRDSVVEFANSPLVEFRTYDKRLDQELDNLYPVDLKNGNANELLARKKVNATVRLRRMLLDIQELTDRASHSPKIMVERLGLNDRYHWLNRKVGILTSIYRFLNDQAQHDRYEFLELIVLLIVIGMVINLLGLHH